MSYNIIGFNKETWLDTLFTLKHAEPQGHVGDRSAEDGSIESYRLQSSSPGAITSQASSNTIPPSSLLDFPYQLIPSKRRLFRTQGVLNIGHPRVSKAEYRE